MLDPEAICFRSRFRNHEASERLWEFILIRHFYWSPDALIDISIDLASEFFILCRQNCTEVHATAVRVS